MNAKKKTDFNFEKALDDLNNIVEKMEEGDLSLEDSLKSFENGIGLIRQCQTTLKDAEQKVKVLVKSGGKNKLEDYEVEE